MVKLIIKARIKESQIQRFIKRGQDNVGATLKEKGCIKNELYQDLLDPTVFIFDEEWASEEDLARHNETDQVKEMNKIIPEMADGEPEFYSVKRIY